MAKLGNFLQVTDIRGSIGGNVFTKARGINTLRARVKPRNPRSSNQTDVRGIMTNGARAAQALSSSDKATWDAYASTLTFHNPVTGGAYAPTWMQAYMQCYLYLLLATPTATTPTAAPTSPFTDPALTLTATTPSANEIFIASSIAQPADTTFFVYAERLKSANRTPSAKPGKLISVAPVAGMGHSLAITGLDPGVYAVKYRVVDVTNGQFGPLHSLPNQTVTS